MRMCLVLLSCFTFSLSASTYAQQERVSLNMKEVTVKMLLDEIQRQTDLHFIFNTEQTNSLGKVSIEVRNESVEAVLIRLFEGTDLTYSFRGNIIVVKRREDTRGQQEMLKITGKVVDEKKQVLPGVTVKLEGTTVGTATNTKGVFSLMLPVREGFLEFSFVGFKSKKVRFTEKSDTLLVVLVEDLKQIEEVVVTGYQVIKEKAMAGSYSKVKAEDLIMTGNETIESMLQGKIPGMMVTHTSGLTGTRQKVRVRGTSTLVGNADPVWVVDGIIQEDNLPFEAESLAAISDDNLDMMKEFIGGAVSWLNPNDIEDITVLKDASATAIYGVKAANGVILITTKKGERGRLSVNYSGNFSMSQRLNYNRMEIMNSKDRVALSREAFERGAQVSDERIGYIGLALAYSRREISLDEFHKGVKKFETANTDWFDILYRTPFSQSHSLSFSGGNEDATYRASFGYRNQKNTAKGNEQESYTGNLNMTTIFWKQLTLTASLSGNHTETIAFASGVDPYNYAINTSRTIPCYDEGQLYYYENGMAKYNILNELENSGNKNSSKSINLNLNARWRVYEDLTISATLGGASSSSFAETWFSERSHKITAIRGYEYGEFTVTDNEYKKSKLPYGGMLTVSESRNFNYTARIQAEFVKLCNGVHAVNLVAGFETRSNQYKGFSQTNWGIYARPRKELTNVPLNYGITLVENTEYARTIPSVTDRLSNYISYYMSGGYMYDNRYSINFSVRGDASNRFGGSTKFQPVWSGGLRWNVTDEHWMEGQNLVNNLSFSATFGYQGNVAENVSPDFIAKMGSVDSKTGEWKMTWSQLPNPDLKPEKTLSVNLGVNFAFLKSKLTGTFNWYYKKTTDVITTAKIPYENGTTSMALNDGDVKNKGWDLAFSVVPVRTKNFMWSLGTSFSGNDNTVNSKLESTKDWKKAAAGTLNKKGYPVGSFWAFRFTGLNPEHGAPMFDFSRADTRQAAGRCD